MTNHLRSLGTQFSVPINPDENGYIGRECPNQKCLGYFKITPGTGVKGPATRHCPYCGQIGEQRNFFTPEQIEYGRSIVIQKVLGAVHKDLKAMEFDHTPCGPFGIGFSMKVRDPQPYPISHYRERQLETEVLCDSCGLRYAIYGVFGWCPDCGVHNSLQILTKNLDLARKQLELARSADADLADHLVGDALENIVSAFDGFGRKICTQKGADIHFQNIVGARQKVQQSFGFDFADALTAGDWDRICRVFQKRHLLAHKMGVIDDEYVRRANDRTAVIGRRIQVTPDEVKAAIGIIKSLGRHLFTDAIGSKP